MSIQTSKTQATIVAAFSKVIEQLGTTDPTDYISDLNVQYDEEANELRLYDDVEKLLTKTKWTEEKQDINKIIGTLRKAFSAIQKQELFDNPCFLRPFSINLVEKDFFVVEELLFIDEDLYRIDDPLLKGFDQELDSFIKDLLSDVK